MVKNPKRQMDRLRELHDADKRRGDSSNPALGIWLLLVSAILTIGGLFWLSTLY